MGIKIFRIWLFSAWFLWRAGRGHQAGAGRQEREDSGDGEGEWWEETAGILITSLPEPETDAKVRAEGHGGFVHRGDEHRREHLEEQPGVSTGPAGRQERDPDQEDEVDQHTKVGLDLYIHILYA